MITIYALVWCQALHAIGHHAHSCLSYGGQPTFSSRDACEAYAAPLRLRIAPGQGLQRDHRMLRQDRPGATGRRIASPSLCGRQAGRPSATGRTAEISGRARRGQFFPARRTRLKPGPGSISTRNRPVSERRRNSARERGRASHPRGTVGRRHAGGSRRRAERAAPGCSPGFGFPVVLSVQRKEAIGRGRTPHSRKHDHSGLLEDDGGSRTRSHPAPDLSLRAGPAAHTPFPFSLDRRRVPLLCPSSASRPDGRRFDERRKVRAPYGRGAG